MGNQTSSSNINNGGITVVRNRNQSSSHIVSTVSTGSSTSTRGSSNTGAQQQQQQQLPPPVAVSAMKSMFQQLTVNRESKNALGLSKAELDERCKPSGLYRSCNWDEKAIRRMIGDGKLASRQQYTDEMQVVGQQQEQHECPICFFSYRQMNITKCCQADICTECYLQLQPYQKQSRNPNNNEKPVINVKTQQNSCPFCNTAKLQVSVVPLKAPQLTEQEQQPEQAVTTPVKVAPTDQDEQQPEMNPNNTTVTPTTPKTGFGSSLEQDAHVAMMRARSCSIASEHSHSSSTPSIKEQQDIVSTIAATPEDRQHLEDEMRAQHLHPLALKIQQEENERRLKNELQYYSQRNLLLQQGRQQSASMTAATPTTATSAAVARSHPQQNIPRRTLLSPQPYQRSSTSDMLFLHHPNRSNVGGVGGAAPLSSSVSAIASVRGMSEEQQLALAIEASLRETMTSGSAAP